MRTILALIGDLLLFVSVAAFAWCGFVLARAHREQAKASAVLDRELAVGSTVRTVIDKAPPHGPLGRIDIPRVGLSSVILEGTGSSTLAVSVGHIQGTARPGSDGNIALAAHRDTLFRGLENIRVGDDVLLTSVEGGRDYRVDSTRVVAPTDVYVLKESGPPMLTLITCYPFHYIGPAPKRFVVRAILAGR